MTTVDEYSKLKRALFRYKITAYLAVIVLCITNFNEVVVAWHNIFPSETLIISCSPKKYSINRYENLSLKPVVIMNSERPVAIKDVIVSLLFYKFENETGHYQEIVPSETYRYVALDNLNTSIPPLSNQHDRQEIKLNIRFQRSGEYMVLMKASSSKLNQLSEERLYINVPSIDLDALNCTTCKIPIFVVKEDILDISPKLFSNFDSFKVVLLNEAEATNPLKSTVIFSQDYLGAAGGLGYSLYRYSLTGSELSYGFSQDPYLSEIRDENINEEKIERLRFISDEPEIIPIGSSFYRVSILDDQRIKFEKVNVKNCEIIGEKKWVWGTLDWMDWEIPAYKLKFRFKYDCGATGRNCDFILKYNGKEYHLIEHYEPAPYPIETDFPIFTKSDDCDIKIDVVDTVNGDRILRVQKYSI